MRLLMTLGVLLVVLLTGGLLFQLSREADREARVAGAANSLIWQALGLPLTPRFLPSEVRGDPEDEQRWTVEGRFEVEPADGAGPPRALGYVAALRLVCTDARLPGCWSLRELIVDELVLVSGGSLDPETLAAAGLAPRGRPAEPDR